MEVFSHFEDVRVARPDGLCAPPFALVIGNLDGVHRGHRALLDQASAISGSVGVLTFSPHPTSLLAPEYAPELLMTPDEKRDGLAACDVDATLFQTFNKAFAGMSPQAFIDDVLVGALKPAAVVVGADFSFGFKGRGDVALLRTELTKSDIALAVADTVKEGGLVVSSSHIRRFLHEGRVDAAKTLLGRPYTTSGRVIRGDGRGRTIGIPTANIETPTKLIPKLGVYATSVALAGQTHLAVTNIGLRPTFDGEGVRIETHILDGAFDLYEQTIEVAFHQRLRGERKFPSAQALVEQVQTDIHAARTALEASPP